MRARLQGQKVAMEAPKVRMPAPSKVPVPVLPAQYPPQQQPQEAHSLSSPNPCKTSRLNRGMPMGVPELRQVLQAQRALVPTSAPRVQRGTAVPVRRLLQVVPAQARARQALVFRTRPP
ncbi:uncharacterized protein LOC132707039 [Cylas formicarius]|uniref:uncharacterized protein LOC132707039 n=1 Tax=Cylas formicarius TaxID=197179 RepID=UPI0029589594|nr:uncharacterized protein LOC132707039 [Cylas formicarius]